MSSRLFCKQTFAGKTSVRGLTDRPVLKSSLFLLLVKFNVAQMMVKWYCNGALSITRKSEWIEIVIF